MKVEVLKSADPSSPNQKIRRLASRKKSVDAKVSVPLLEQHPRFAAQFALGRQGVD
jgi:hypothetical protein